MTAVAIRVAEAPGPEFHEVAARVAAVTPHAAPPAPARVAAAVARPRYRDRQRVCVATRTDGPVARVVARVATDVRDGLGRPVGCLGWFEALDDPAAITVLLTAARAWLRAAGAGDVLAPFEGDTWHPYRCATGPFVAPPFLREPWNPPWYPDALAANGFAAAERYCTLRADDPAALAAHYAPRHAAATARGYRFQAITAETLPEALGALYALSLDAFAENPYYAPIDRAEFDALYAGAGALVAPGLVQFARAPDGTPAGFAFGYPDRDGAGPLLDLKTLAVAPAHRRRGLATALCHGVYAGAAALGLRRVNLCLIRAGNPSERVDGGTGRVFREYALFRLPEPGP